MKALVEKGGSSKKEGFSDRRMNSGHPWFDTDGRKGIPSLKGGGFVKQITPEPLVRVLVYRCIHWTRIGPERLRSAKIKKGY